MIQIAQRGTGKIRRGIAGFNGQTVHKSRRAAVDSTRDGHRTTRSVAGIQSDRVDQIDGCGKEIDRAARASTAGVMTEEVGAEIQLGHRGAVDTDPDRSAIDGFHRTIQVHHIRIIHDELAQFLTRCPADSPLEGGITAACHIDQQAVIGRPIIDRGSEEQVIRILTAVQGDTDDRTAGIQHHRSGEGDRTRGAGVDIVIQIDGASRHRDVARDRHIFQIRNGCRNHRQSGQIPGGTSIALQVHIASPRSQGDGIV